MMAIYEKPSMGTRGMLSSGLLCNSEGMTQDYDLENFWEEGDYNE